MKNHVLLESYLKSLRLPVFKSEYERAARECSDGDLSYEDFLLCLCEMEASERDRKAVSRRFRQAGFPSQKELSDFDFTAVPKLNKRRLLDLGRCEWLARHENIVFLGSPGVGKTHLSIALGREACRLGRQVKFFTAVGLSTAYAEACEERHLQRLERSILKSDLIILDELGYVPLGQGASENLFNFVSSCYERTSLIVTTNLPFSNWPEVFGDDRLTGALLDRLTHRIHVIEVPGESYRFKESMSRRGSDQERGGDTR